MMIERSLPLRLQHALTTAIADRPADVLLLSGGVDSSILLATASDVSLTPHLAITVSLASDPCPVHGDTLAVPCNSDDAFAGRVTSHLGAAWQPIRLSKRDALAALIALCLSLRSFDLGNLNNIALHVGAGHAARLGARRIWTGDDADSLFGGYRHLTGEHDWQGYLARRIPTIRPPFTDIASLNDVTPIYPWLHPSVLEVATSLHRDEVLRTIPVSEQPHMPSFVDQFDQDATRATKRLWGKVPLRELAAKHLPSDIAWRPKTDLEFGSGMCALEAPLAATVTPDDRPRLNRTGIRFFNDAHRGLYLHYLHAGGIIPAPGNGQYACASCGGGVDAGRRHCPTCGAWPADQR